MRTVLRLHGYPVSNYVSTVHAALIEKGLDHEIVARGAARDESFLALNPMGKIPVLETSDGYIGETVAILDFLDDAYGDVPLRAADSFGRARMRQINNVLQLYMEAPARSLYVGTFAAGRHDERQVAAVRQMLDRSTEALRRLSTPAPFLLGERLTQSDLLAFFTLELVDRLSRFVWGRSAVEELGWTGWRVRMRACAAVSVVLAAFETSFRDYLQTHDAPYCELSPAHEEICHA